MTKTKASTVEQRVARVSRRMARVIIEIERDGEVAGAARLRAAAAEVVEQMRAGRL